MSDDGSNQSDIPLTPFGPTGDTASKAPFAKFPAHPTGAPGGSSQDLQVALESACSQIFL